MTFKGLVQPEGFYDSKSGACGVSVVPRVSAFIPFVIVNLSLVVVVSW